MSSTFADARLAALDGFRVEIDPARERADVILDRPPFNIVSMPQRDQLRLVFEAWMRTRACGSSCCARSASISPAAATSKVSWKQRPNRSPSRLEHRRAGALRKPVIAANRGFCFGVGFELSLACDFRLVSETCFYACRSSGSARFPAPGARRGCRRSSASPAPRTS